MSHFFAMLSRMKYINRWGLMRNTREENLSEHSFNTAIIAHALAVIRNRFFAGEVDPQQTAVFALFHDAPEIITGDMPTPIKYYSPDIHSAYSSVEQMAQTRLLHMLPDSLREDYRPLLSTAPKDPVIVELVKAADKIVALIKCVEERCAGNNEFVQAEKAISKTVAHIDLPEVAYFMKEFFPSYRLTLDEQE